MIRDIAFEAAFLRAGLLVGLVHEQDVPEWAVDAISSAPGASGQLSDVALTTPELSAMRESLRRLGEGVESDRVVAALLTAISVSTETTRRSAENWLRVLGQIRYEFRPASPIAAAIKEFEDRAMLARAGVKTKTAPSGEELAGWLDSVRAVGYFYFSFQDAAEAAAFVAALSRKFVRNRTWGNRSHGERARVWALREPEGEARTFVLNERAWQTATQEFSPVPLASRVPHAALPAGAVVIVDEAAATALGLDDAQRVIAG